MKIIPLADIDTVEMKGRPLMRRGEEKQCVAEERHKGPAGKVEEDRRGQRGGKGPSSGIIAAFTLK